MWEGLLRSLDQLVGRATEGGGERQSCLLRTGGRARLLIGRLNGCPRPLPRVLRSIGGVAADNGVQRLRCVDRVQQAFLEFPLAGLRDGG